MDPHALAAVDLDRLWLAIFGESVPRAEGGTDAELRARLDVAFAALSERDASTLLAYFTVPKTTYEQVAAAKGVSRERIRQILSRALRRLRHPSLSRSLRGLGPVQPPASFVITEATEIRELMNRRLIGTLAGNGLVRGPYYESGEWRPIRTVGEARHAADEFLLTIRNFGPSSLAEVRRVCGPFEEPEVLPACVRRYGESDPEDAAELAELSEALKAALGSVPTA